jgi:hypothetical protein
MIDENTIVRVCMTCEYCAWTAMHTGPAGEVAVFLRELAIVHVHEVHPEKVPAGDIDLTVLSDLGFH